MLEHLLTKDEIRDLERQGRVRFINNTSIYHGLVIVSDDDGSQAMFRLKPKMDCYDFISYLKPTESKRTEEDAD
jgi:hypothetical protein